MMWGQSGGRSFIKGNSIGAFLLRLLVVAFLTGGALAIVALATRFLGAARAQQDAPVEGVGEIQVVNPQPDPPLLSGALIMRGVDDLPHALEAGWKGEKTCELLQENDAMRAFRCVFPPGVGHEKHWHAPHFGYIVKGSKMRIADEKGTREADLKDGASWQADGVVHEALNVGKKTAIYVIVEPKGATAE